MPTMSSSEGDNNTKWTKILEEVCKLDGKVDSLLAEIHVEEIGGKTGYLISTSQNSNFATLLWYPKLLLESLPMVATRDEVAMLA